MTNNRTHHNQPAASLLTGGLAAIVFCLAFFALAATSAQSQALTPAWVEVGPDGAAVARIVVNAPTDCPRIRVNRATHAMTLRQPTPPNFRPVCEFAIPANAKSARVGTQTLVLPKKNPTRVLAFGDTGCRIKGAAIQACNDTAQWPFATVAAQAATEKAQLMIHVGDYLYRESPCPPASETLCGGTPDGDNWPSWQADFFTPAAKLLAAVPWAFARGNHEDCNRSWRGWFYYLDPRPWTGMCEEYSKPYIITLGDFQLVMLDSAAVSVASSDKDQVTEYTSQLLSLHPKNAWLVDHHPFWGFANEGGGAPPVPISVPLEEAFNQANPTGYTLFLSGHVHLFEYVELDQGKPPQLVVGDGGTKMDPPMSAAVKGITFHGATLEPDSDADFGYTLFEKSPTGWNLTLKDRTGKPLLACQIPGGIKTCKQQ